MINVPKGTKDVLPDQSYKWQYIEKTAREVAGVFNFKEVRTPTFEYTELFKRGVGETTDVVNKEMYTFEDRGGRSITLKPEGTAGVARMFIENGLASSPMPVKAFYITPAFRQERPQAGRLREFHQFGLEAFGSAAPETDAELIFAASTFINKLKIKGVKLEINSIGCHICRNEYNIALKEFFKPRFDELCPTCQTRYEKNPLRLLDCKEEGCKQINKNAPSILDYLCDDCKAHFESVKNLLREMGVEYEVNPRIVRGLDYYTRTVFEFISTEIGAQGAVCAGGRYDGLIASLGGQSLPAIGFAAGIERLILVMENTFVPFPEEKKPLIYLAGMNEESRAFCMKTAAYLRVNGISAEVDLMSRSVKSQMKYADKIGAKYVAVVGESELLSGEINLKKMCDGTQTAIKTGQLFTYLQSEDKK